VAHILVLSYRHDDHNHHVNSIQTAADHALKGTKHSVEVIKDLDNKNGATPSCIVCDLSQIYQLQQRILFSSGDFHSYSKAPIIMIGDSTSNLLYTRNKIGGANLIGKMGEFAQNITRSWQHLTQVIDNAQKPIDAASFEAAYSKVSIPKPGLTAIGRDLIEEELPMTAPYHKEAPQPV